MARKYEQGRAIRRQGWLGMASLCFAAGCGSASDGTPAASSDGEEKNPETPTISEMAEMPMPGAPGAGVPGVGDVNAGMTSDPTPGSAPVSACDDRRVVLASFQAQVDALAGCTSLYGLSVRGELDLRPLSALRRVGEGGLVLQEISNLEGLEGLRETASLSLILNPFPDGRLSSLDGLERVERLEIAATDLLDLQGLEAIRGLQQISIHDNFYLISLSGLALASGELSQLRLELNPALAEIEALRPLTTIRERFLLQGSGLQSLDALENLSDVGQGEIVIRENLSLVDITGLRGLRSVRELEIIDNRNLTTVPEFAALTELSSFVLIRNDALSATPRFPLITSMSEALIIEDNYGLQTLDGFAALETISAISITENVTLSELDLGALRAASDELVVVSNSALNGADIARLFEPVQSARHRVGLDQSRRFQDPCPWTNDVYCDDDVCLSGADPVCAGQFGN